MPETNIMPYVNYTSMEKKITIQEKREILEDLWEVVTFQLDLNSQ